MNNSTKLSSNGEVSIKVCFKITLGSNISVLLKGGVVGQGTTRELGGCSRAMYRLATQKGASVHVTDYQKVTRC